MPSRRRKDYFLPAVTSSKAVLELLKTAGTVESPSTGRMRWKHDLGRPGRCDADTVVGFLETGPIQAGIISLVVELAFVVTMIVAHMNSLTLQVLIPISSIGRQALLQLQDSPGLC